MISAGARERKIQGTEGNAWRSTGRTRVRQASHLSTGFEPGRESARMIVRTHDATASRDAAGCVYRARRMVSITGGSDSTWTSGIAASIWDTSVEPHLDAWKMKPAGSST